MPRGMYKRKKRKLQSRVLVRSQFTGKRYMDQAVTDITDAITVMENLKTDMRGKRYAISPAARWHVQERTLMAQSILSSALKKIARINPKTRREE